ncbi:MAG: acyl carrier protein [Verrucomicrobiae bacterium]|nr:acyl carrier protein [Verrucomicrobiae bacterium]
MKLLNWLFGRTKNPRQKPIPSTDWAALHFTQPQQAIAARVADIICEQLGVTIGQLTPDTRFIENLGADSLDFVEMLMAFEEEFQIKLPDADSEKPMCVGDLIEYFERRLQHDAPSVNDHDSGEL